MDIAALGFDIDSSQAAKAVKNLDRLSASASIAEKSAQTLGAS